MDEQVGAWGGVGWGGVGWGGVGWGGAGRGGVGWGGVGWVGCILYHHRPIKGLISEPINSIGLRTKVSILVENEITFRK